MYWVKFLVNYIQIFKTAKTKGILICSENTCTDYKKSFRQDSKATSMSSKIAMSE
jgi:hypothetical protein